MSTLLRSPEPNEEESPRYLLSDHTSSFQLHLEVPGLRQDSLRVRINDQSLEVTGKRVLEDYFPSKVIRRTFSAEDYDLTIDLPARVKREGANAKYRDGILLITLPKEEDEEAGILPIEFIEKK